jgi:hypothetical protein
MDAVRSVLVMIRDSIFETPRGGGGAGQASEVLELRFFGSFGQRDMMDDCIGQDDYWERVSTLLKGDAASGLAAMAIVALEPLWTRCVVVYAGHPSPCDTER